MKTLSNFAIIFSFFSAFLLSVSWASTNHTSHQAFVQCLESHSNPTNPISAVLYSPYNPSYSSVLQDYFRNLRFNKSTIPKPRLILTALHVSHIQAAIICAKAHRMQMKIRSGGHDYEGISYWSKNPNFFILDMFNFRSINVSIEDETASVEVGAATGELAYRIAEKSRTHAFPPGVCPSVGVGGFITGGGYGNLMRKYGLSIDNVIDAQIIDVNGRLLDRKSMGEDLFWAINGGGGSSFGVLLSYKIKLVRVPNNVTVFTAIRTTHDESFTSFTDLVYRYQEVAHKLPKELFIRLILDVVNGTKTNKGTVNGTKTNRGTFLAMFLGNSQDLMSVMNKHFSELALRQTELKEMRWIESILYWYWTDLATPVDALLHTLPRGSNCFKRKSDYLKRPIPKQGLEYIFKKMVELESVVNLTFNPYGGRMAEISPSEKPFPHRAGNIFKLQYATNWKDPGEEAAHLSSTRKLHDYMTPYVSMAPREAFLNYRDLDIGINHNGRNSYLEGAVYGVKYFKDNFNRLVKIKTKVDPDNFFRNEQSIPVLPWKK
ncbi:Tetrahydroberberine oxidase [Handroanthus impetiginosus]|uniref:Tetrahydroberberine oxidase n=1 Tax=Handroanthus impetiginosus TaxID=429701 RepID=A0A2G9GA38_9LAMI|nr:Tetrahydroberberine oxidase [Handroanthus impetiginosus]